MRSLIAKSEAIKQVEQEKPSTAPDSSKATDGSLNQAELAKRFNVDTSNVGRTWKEKGEEGFRLWSKKKDPESIAWRRCEKTGRYFKDEPS